MAQPIWQTPAGSLATYAALLYVETQLVATPVSPATSLTFALISGTLPLGMTISTTGLISGTPLLVTSEVTSTFCIRVTDNLGSIRDRTFSIVTSGTAVPSFVTPPGTLLNVNDSTWIELQLDYNNPDPANPITISLLEGVLPPGLEISESGLIRGYAEPPTVGVTLPPVSTAATLTDVSNVITCVSTAGFSINRPIVFTGTVLGNLDAGFTYYIKSIINSTSFTVSETQNGSTVSLTTDSGFMTVTLPAISVGQPTVRTYTFTLKISSPMGNDISDYAITVTNQNAPFSQGGPGYPANTRVPAILNTKPLSLFTNNSDPNFGYYVLPEEDSGYSTYPVSVPAFIGTVQSDNYFAFRVIGKDFDGTILGYSYSGLPPGLVGDPLTGWITGTPVLSSAGINQYSFSVSTYKLSNPSVQTPYVNFSFKLTNEITGIITWVTPSNLGTVFNGTVSTKGVLATSDVELEYRIVNGNLPPNLTLLPNGQITGFVANQPTSELLPQGTNTVFEVDIQAFAVNYPVVQSTKKFTITVVQRYNQPTDILYIKAAPSINDRRILQTLLEDETLIPEEVLYRPYDVYFGKASSVIYAHAYGVFASSIDEYIAAVMQNHYWRNITLGEIKTAVAKNDLGEVIYEVVYSEVVDDLVNSHGVSVSEQIQWETTIDLGIGPWYTSVTDIYTSYSDILGKEYYTSLSPGYTKTLYPNSLFNMRNRVANLLGQEYDSSLLPLWMTSQQADGSTLGYKQAWVICYTKPGLSATVKDNINNNWKTPYGTKYKLNMINFRIDRFTVDKSITYNYDKSLSPPAWTGLPSATPVPDDLNSKNFHVLFPRQTILPDSTEN